MPELLTKTTTLTEYLLLPYDGKRTEFVNSEIEYMSDPSVLHVAIIDALQEVLKAHIKAQTLSLSCLAGPSVEIPREGTNNIRKPDLTVCDRQQWRSMMGLTKAIFSENSPPALVVEVVSPGGGGATRDLVDKRLEYALAGIPEYWIINPDSGYVLILSLNETCNYDELGEFRETEQISSTLFPHLVITADKILNPI